MNEEVAFHNKIRKLKGWKFTLKSLEMWYKLII